MPDIRELRKRTRDSLATPSPNSSQADDPFQLSPESCSPLHKRIRAFTSRLRHSVGSSIYSSRITIKLFSASNPEPIVLVPRPIYFLSRFSLRAQSTQKINRSGHENRTN